MSAKWLHQVLAESTVLNLDHTDGRAAMADAILRAIPKDVIVAAISESAAAVLRCQHAIPRIDEISKEIGRNAAMTVLLMLEVDLDDEVVVHESAAAEVLARVVEATCTHEDIYGSTFIDGRCTCGAAQ